MRKKSSHQLGLTLLEVMMAAGVLALAMVMAMGSLMSISATTAQSEDQAAGAAAVSSIIEQIRAMPIENIRNYTPPVGGRLTTQAWVVRDDNEFALPAAQDAPAAAFRPPLQVRVRVQWLDTAGRPRAIDTTTIVGD